MDDYDNDVNPDDYESGVIDDRGIDVQRALDLWLAGGPTEFCHVCEEERPAPAYFIDVHDKAICTNCQDDISEAKRRNDRGPSNFGPGREKKRISAGLRTRVFERDAYRCRYCGGYDGLSADHVIPESTGGPTTFENLVAACRPCNTKKGPRTPEDAGMPLLPQP